MKKRQLSSSEKIAWLRLIRSENIGPATMESLMRFYEKPSDALKALPEFVGRAGVKKVINICPEEAAEQEMERLEKLGGQMLFSCEANYPHLLGEIKNPPPVLSVLGHTSLFKSEAVAFVGSRNASFNGRNITRQLAFGCVERGISVISGMALGIDGAAHEGALACTTSQSAGTVAVLGSGVDVVYPEEHKKLYEQIIERGAVVSEFALGTKPNAKHFPRRNRIIAGLAQGTLVVEAKSKSGSLITAEYAKELGRLLMAVPGSPLDERSYEPNRLIQSGAQMIQSVQDITRALSSVPAEQLDLHETVEEVSIFRLPPMDAVDEARPLVLSALSPEPVLEESLIADLGLPSTIVSVILLELELAGKLERHATGAVSLKGALAVTPTKQEESLED